MPNLQRCCSVHPAHPVDTCQGAVNFLPGSEPFGAHWTLFGSEVEGAAVDVMINYILWMTRQYRVKTREARDLAGVFVHGNGATNCVAKHADFTNQTTEMCRIYSISSRVGSVTLVKTKVELEMLEDILEVFCLAPQVHPCWSFVSPEVRQPMSPAAPTFV